MEMMKGGMEEARIRKVGVLSVANISGVINAIIGLLFGLLFILFSSLVSSVFPSGQQGTFSILSFGNFGYLSIIIFPIIYGILGFIAGAIGAFLYNIAAKITKGIKLYSN